MSLHIKSTGIITTQLIRRLSIQFENDNPIFGDALVKLNEWGIIDKDTEKIIKHRLYIKVNVNGKDHDLGYADTINKSITGDSRTFKVDGMRKILFDILNNSITGDYTHG